MACAERPATMPDMTALARPPDLTSVSCLLRYSALRPASLGLAAMALLPSTAWQAAQIWLTMLSAALGSPLLTGPAAGVTAKADVAARAAARETTRFLKGSRSLQKFGKRGV